MWPSSFSVIGVGVFLGSFEGVILPSTWTIEAAEVDFGGEGEGGADRSQARAAVEEERRLGGALCLL